MARSRTIKPSFFENEDLAECSAFARLLFIGLWTICDREGRLEYRPKRIKSQVFPYEEVSVPDLLSELAERGFIQLYPASKPRFIAVVNFVKHQRPHPKETPSELPSLDDVTYEAESTSEKAVKLHGSAAPKNGQLRPFPSPSSNNNNNNADPGEDVVDVVVASLIEAGIERRRAVRLGKMTTEQALKGILAASKSADKPTGFIVTAIENGWDFDAKAFAGGVPPPKRGRESDEEWAKRLASQLGETK
jgi:hypothetical protein